MPIPSLLDQYIDETYQRLVQTDSTRTEFADGLGNPITFGLTSPGGTNQTIQFNSASVFSGSSNFKFDYTANNLVLTGSILMSGSSYISGVDYLQFDTTASNTPDVGKLYWNDVDGTLELGLKGGTVRSELGQGLVTRVVNKTSPLVDLAAASYQVVVVGGAQGQRLSVKLAQADNDANSAGTLGVVAEDIARNQEGFVITVGLLKNRDTTGALQGETWNDGDILYLSPFTAGAITNIKPQAPNHTVIIGYVEYAHQNNGKLYIKIDNGYELDELHNVRITTASLATGDLLHYVSGSNVWVNTRALSGSYTISGSLTLSGSLTTNDGVKVQTLTASIVSASQFTGSLFGTSSWANNVTTASYITSSFFTGTNAALSASYASTASNIQGGLSTYIPLWDTDTKLTSSYFNQSTNTIKTIYNGTDIGLKLDFGTSEYVIGDPLGNQKILVNTFNEYVALADQGPAGIKVEGASARAVTIGDAWGNAGTNTKVVVDATNNTVQITGSFSVQNGAEFLGSITMVLGNYGDDTEAAANGVPINGLYRKDNVVSIRVT